ncbi:MAG: hypothetical protein MUF58_09815 [Arcicella sp.]|jgi:hypothetical protein|nr:hypothetical protein [Arcicella sp.]
MNVKPLSGFELNYILIDAKPLTGRKAAVKVNNQNPDGGFHPVSGFVAYTF